MGIVTVRVQLKDSTLAATPVAGATVRFYTTADVFVTEETTNALGIVDVLLNGAAYPTGVDYHVRAYKPGCSFGTPKTIEVFDPPEAAPNNNDFAWTVNVFEVENSPTPGLCRASGPIMRVDGSLAKSQRLVFKAWPTETPSVFYDHLVSPQPPPLCEIPTTLEARSDDSGIFRIDLLRGGKYTVIVPGWDEEFRLIRVPDRAGVLLADLIWPIPMQVTYDPVAPYVILVNASLLLTPTVLFSDYNDYADGGVYVTYESDDLTVLTVARSTGGMVNLTGVKAGAASIVAKRGPNTFKVVPSRSFIGDTVGVVIV